MDGDKRNSGARKRSYLSKAAAEKGSSTKRNVLGAGALDLLSLSNGVYEFQEKPGNSTLIETINNESTKENDQIFEVGQHVKDLIRDLEISEQKKKPEDK